MTWTSTLDFGSPLYVLFLVCDVELVICKATDKQMCDHKEQSLTFYNCCCTVDGIHDSVYQVSSVAEHVQVLMALEIASIVFR